MPNPDTITRGAGQARRSAARLILSVAKYTGLTLAGIILFRAGAAYGLKERGYSAAGGAAYESECKQLTFMPMNLFDERLFKKILNLLLQVSSPQMRDMFTISLHILSENSDC